MLVTVSGESGCLDQSLKTLGFASRATYIQNKSLKSGCSDEDTKTRKAALDAKTLAAAKLLRTPQHLPVDDKGYSVIPTKVCPALQ